MEVTTNSLAVHVAKGGVHALKADNGRGRSCSKGFKSHAESSKDGAAVDWRKLQEASPHTEYAPRAPSTTCVGASRVPARK